MPLPCAVNVGPLIRGPEDNRAGCVPMLLVCRRACVRFSTGCIRCTDPVATLTQSWGGDADLGGSGDGAICADVVATAVAAAHRPRLRRISAADCVPPVGEPCLSIVVDIPEEESKWPVVCGIRLLYGRVADATSKDAECRMKSNGKGLSRSPER